MVRERGDEPSWGITKVASSGTIWLRFVGPTPTHEVNDFISALSEMMPGEDASIVFDLRELNGYNPASKEPIKAWLRENKARIAQVTVLAPKSGTIVKVVTALIALATGVKIRIRDDLDEGLAVVSA